MTIEAFYAAVGGDYQATLRRLMVIGMFFFADAGWMQYMRTHVYTQGGKPILAAFGHYAQLGFAVCAAVWAVLFFALRSREIPLWKAGRVLTAIALATVFYKPNFRSALWAVLGILVTVFIQAGMYMLMAPVGIATLTGPFCITTWLFLLPLVRFDDEEKPDHSNWYPENKKHLAAQQPGAKTE